MESGVNRWYDLWWREGGTAGTGHVTYIYNMQVILATIILGMFDLGQRSSNPQSKQDCWSRIQLELKSFVLKFWKWILNFRIKKWHINFNTTAVSCTYYVLWTLTLYSSTKMIVIAMSPKMTDSEAISTARAWDGTSNSVTICRTQRYRADKNWLPQGQTCLPKVPFQWKDLGVYILHTQIKNYNVINAHPIRF